jgi:hypothetical protein
MNKAESIDKMAKNARAAEVRAVEPFIDSVTKGLKKRNSKVIHQICTDY